jgi:hypothetical protein
MPLPGGRIHATPRWAVHHVLGPLGLGALAVVPVRHVVGTADLTDGETDELGHVLRAAARVVASLTGPIQVYTCQWSHRDGKRRTFTSSASRSGRRRWTAAQAGWVRCCRRTSSSRPLVSRMSGPSKNSPTAHERHSSPSGKAGRRTVRCSRINALFRMKKE